jgi:hypothetical protein
MPLLCVFCGVLHLSGNHHLLSPAALPGNMVCAPEKAVNNQRGSANYGCLMAQVISG